MNRGIVWHPHIRRFLLCIGWVLATTMALHQSTSISQIHYQSWPDTSYLLVFTPLLLAIWEPPLIFLHVYWVTKNWKTSLIRSLLWSLSILLMMPFTLPISLLFLVITPFGFIIIELIIGLLQWRVIKPFSSHSLSWPLIRVLAFSIATLIGSLIAQESNSYQAVFSIISPTGMPSTKDALTMGLIGGLIKGVGFVYFLRLSPRKHPADT